MQVCQHVSRPEAVATPKQIGLTVGLQGGWHQVAGPFCLVPHALMHRASEQANTPLSSCWSGSGGGESVSSTSMSTAEQRNKQLQYLNLRVPTHTIQHHNRTAYPHTHACTYT